MQKKRYSFKGFETDAEVEFIKHEAKRKNATIDTVIKKLIQNAMGREDKEPKEPKSQIEILKAELEELKEIGIFAAENAIYAKYLVLANLIELAKEDQDKIRKTKKLAKELTEKEIKGFNSEYI